MRTRQTVLRCTLLVAVMCLGACRKKASTLGESSTVRELMKARGLNEADVEAALKTYTPSGKMDEYYMFAGGGQSGNVDVIGVPSMRLLKVIGVFTPEPWQGWGYGGEGDKVLAEGNRGAHKLTWGDVHHPALSETKGDYDGKFLFVNDKANARVAVIDLSDFVTKQIVVNPLMVSDHAAACVTPDTDYVMETSQYPVPLGDTYAPLEQYKEKYRGLAMFWRFDRTKGRIDPAQSWAIELPPYMQELADEGKLDSDGWAFITTFNTEMAIGGTIEGKPALESGASANAMDLLHIINWRKAEALVKAGKATMIDGVPVLKMDVTVAEGVLTEVGVPRSPHGVEVTPDGKRIVVSGKLDTHVTIYDFAKMKAAIEAKQFEGKDVYGIPILPFKEVIDGQVEIGLGPLHTEFGTNGDAFTSAYIESTVVKWSYKDLTKPPEKIKVEYNVGHLVAAGGETEHPDGKYLVSLNKSSLDRFLPVGPLYPQNIQLIDIAGGKMSLLYDMPIGNGEPHFGQMIKADKVKALHVYPPGTVPTTNEIDPNRVEGGKEKIVRNGTNVEVFMTLIRSHFTPDRIEVNEGDTVTIHVTSLETSLAGTRTSRSRPTSRASTRSTAPSSARRCTRRWPVTYS